MDTITDFENIAPLIEQVRYKKIIIGINGVKGSGKSTIATRILNKLSTNGTVIPFAKPVKDFAMLMGWDGIKNENGRRILQLLGTDIGRNLIHKNIWVYKWLQSCNHSSETVILVDDVRFDNEAELISDLGGILIKVTRKNNTESFGVPGHESEAGITHSGHFNVENDGTLSDLNRYTDCIIEQIKTRLYLYA